ncbi:SixA phosphatase family protein [Roseitranquillus sediminis]|uniref:SixA phosphatase family protein n=1 Tax=Roseitranquillus sediminis TaxID=2809051 RepID=UPI001D0C76D7|nr:histidine phosphatase family protein [Roseitranquillus sediminis]MBM9596429.1 histidine phosphatase family protein [Roseitranquillus sediminis]
MTLRLTLIRHAKSSWADPLDDIDRPLNKRGRKAADVLGHWLAEDRRMPERVFCSPAHRTSETWERIRAAAGTGPAATDVEALYNATAQTILDTLRTAQGQHVALIGHNPGIGAFAARIVSDRPEHERYGDYPTGATTIIDFDTSDWSEVGWGSGVVAEFVIPADLG